MSDERESRQIHDLTRLATAPASSASPPRSPNRGAERTQATGNGSCRVRFLPWEGAGLFRAGDPQAVLIRLPEACPLPAQPMAAPPLPT